MPTTSLKLPEELKQRAADAAHRQGISPHAFMVQAIEQAAIAAELRAGFVEAAQSARAKALQSGMGYEADDVHAYMEARLAGTPSQKPEAKPWRG